MNTSQLEKLLIQQQYDFASDFQEVVLNAVQQNKPAIHKISWFVTGVAASVLFCMAVVYIQDGHLSYDTLLGIDSLYNDTLNEFNEYL